MAALYVLPVRRTSISASTPAGISSKEIVVKVNVPEVLRAELMRPSWTREHVALGTNTDPYQWVEGRYRLMPGIWEAMRDSGTPSSVLTKSPLLLRDIELMKEMHEVAGFAANLSIPTLGREGVARQRAAHAASAQADRGGGGAEPGRHPYGRSDRSADAGHQRLARAGGEDPRALRRGGADEHRRHPLHLRGEVRDIFMEWLRSYRPDLVAHYEELYARGAYVGKEERERIRRCCAGARAVGAFRARSPAPEHRSRPSRAGTCSERAPATLLRCAKTGSRPGRPPARRT